MTSLLNNAVGWHGDQALAVRLIAALLLAPMDQPFNLNCQLSMIGRKSWQKQLAERSHLKEVNKVMCEGPE